MEPLNPAKRLHVIVSAVESKVILCSRHYASVFGDICDQLVVIDEAFCKSFPSPRRELEHSLLSLSSTRSALYTIFTSGSTGTPKGVVVEHGSFLSSATGYAKGFLLSHQSRVLLYSSYSFDVSILEMLTPLLLGACVCVVSDHDRLHNLGAAMESLGVNTAFLTPTVARTIDPQSVPTLDVLALGAEPVDRCDIAPWASSIRHLFELYGPTECGIISSAVAGPSLTSELHNIGRPFNARYWVTAVNDPNSLVPIGAVGELLIEGPILALGYLGDPVKTGNAFVKGLAWATDKQRRFYRTGDVVRYDATGNVIFLGRQDTQVKVRGQRIDLGEIQDGILRSAADVESAVVDIVSIDDRDPMLVAFVCLKNRDVGYGDAQDCPHDYLLPSTPQREAFLSSLNEVEARLLSILPRYMVPYLFVPLRRLPMTASNKVDRKTLRSLAGALSSTELAEYRGPAGAGRDPSTWTERQLQHLWAGVLSMQTDDVSAESSFLALGGDSIRAIRLVAACRARGLQLSIQQIFQHPKLEDMARLLAGNMNTGESTVSAKGDLDPVPFSMFNDHGSPTAPANPALEEVLSQCHLDDEELIEDIYPAAPLQEGLMALSIKEPHSYRAQLVMDLTSAGIDTDRFCASWDQVVELAPILRTRICNTKSKGSLQVVCKEPIEWLTGTDLDDYLAQDRIRPMAFGERLARYAIVRGSAARCHFVWTIHHALYDAWTIRLVLGHVHGIYAGRKIDRPVGFSRYIKYVMENNQAAATATSEEFWRSQLDGACLSEFPRLPRPAYHPRLDTITHHRFDLPPGTQPGGDYTRSTLALAAWAIVISQYTGSEDVVFGTILSGRYAPVEGIEHVLGPTINTIPIRRRIDADQTVRQYLGDFQKQALSMIPHETFGLRRIQRLGDSFHEACQFRSLLVIQPEGRDNGHDANEKVSWLHQLTSPPDELDFAGYPLGLDCTMTERRIKITATYDSHVLDGARMDHVLHQFLHALTQLCLAEKSATRLGSLEILSAHDIQQINDWNSTPPPPVNNYLDAMFTDSALLRPAAPAVDACDGKFTYSELDDLSASLARRLVQLGVGPDTLVPLCFHKSRWYLVAIIATLKAGGTFVPMDPGQPLLRLNNILRQTQAGTVLCSPSNADLLRDTPCDNVVVVGDGYLSESGAPVDGAVEGRRSSHRRPHNAAYIIFTSGSSGEPKGCVVTHQAYSTHLTAHAKHVSGPTVRALQFSSYAFDMSLVEIFTTLVAGGCVCIPSEESRLRDIAGVMSDMKVNWAILTPSVARLIDPAAVPTLQTLCLGGEATSQDNIQTWLGRVRLVQMYGPAECAVASSLVEITDKTHPNDIGKPLMSNYWIVDPQDHEVLLPIGAVGELLIDGPVLARGYLNDAAKTAAAFIEETPRWLRLLKDVDQRPRRMYKTGDLVRYSEAGTVIYMGRKQSDMQVKLRGVRVQLDEVEHHLREALRAYEHDLHIVAELVHVEDKAMLVGFLADVKSSEAHSGSSDQDLFDVDAATRSRLTSTMSRVEGDLAVVMHSSMIPSAYILVRRIPMSATGKTDRALLRRFVSRLSLNKLNALKIKVTEKHVEPSTPMEIRLKDIWAAVLGVERRTISSGDTFFGLGADSITAIRLTGVCRAEGIALSPRNIFQNPVLRDMASVATLINRDDVEVVNGDAEHGPAHFSLLGEMTMYQHAAMECCVAQNDIEDIYPCTALQQGMMAASVRIPGSYAARGLAELRSDVDLDRLRGAWEKTVELNPILRTRLIHSPSQSDGQFVQVVVRESISWRYAESLDDYTAQDSHKTMGLGRPLSRYAIVDDKVSCRRFFVWTVHHALYDGWSMSLILEAVHDAYHRQHDNNTYRRGTRDFRSYVTYLENATSLEAAEAYWTSYLHDATPPSFPPMTLSSARQRPRPDSTLQHTIDIPPASTRHASATFTLPTIIRAAWAVLIARYTDSREVFFGAAVTGRTASLPGIENIVGPTTSTVPIKTVVDPDASVLEHLRQVQDDAAEMMPFETLGIQRIQRLSEGARAACRFQNLLVIQPPSSAIPDLVCPVQVAALGDVLDNVRDTYAMGVECCLAEQSVEVNTAYDSKIISHKQTQRVMSQFGHLVQQLLQASETRLVGELDLLGRDGCKEIASWNAGNEVLQGAKLCLDDMFEESVRRNGAKVAVEAWDGSLSYDALDQAANRLAQHLIDVGVGPEVKVPLCFQKSKWMVVAMLSVVKAGGAMVPLDPAHPRDRLGFIMNAVNAKTVLCSADQASWISQCTNKTAIVVDDSYQPSPDQKTIRGRTGVSNALYVIFTSGSSGEPKGCVVEHQAFCSMVPHLAWGTLFGPSVRILQLASYSFGAAVAEMLATLLYGGSLCIVPSETRANLPKVLKDMNINYMFMTPSFSRLIPPQAISTVKTLIMGAESMTSSDLEKWAPHVRLVQGYGQTECATIMSCHPNMTAKSHPRNVGRPMASRFWIADASDPNILAPIGATGEVFIEGPILAREYLNDPERTAAAFVKPPSWRGTFSALGGCERLYRTGDLARFDDDGTLLFMGRKDNQVNLRGQRIELGEIEYHLQRAMPGAKGVVVELLEMPSSGAVTRSTLVALVALGTELASNDLSDITPAAMEVLRALTSECASRLSRFLPSYMIPSVHLPLGTIPMTASAKVDRRLLRAMLFKLSMDDIALHGLSKVAKREPSTPMEKLLQKLWSSVLLVDANSIGADDHFLQVGGDSMSAIKLASLCQSEGLKLSVADIFENPTLCKMAAALRTTSPTSQAQGFRPFSTIHNSTENGVMSAMMRQGIIDSHDQVQDVLEATYMQAIFVASGLRAPRSKANYVSLDFASTLDMARLKVACHALVERHQILRTVFLAHQHQFLQVVLRSLPGVFSYHPCSSGESLDQLAVRTIEEDAVRDRAALGMSFVRFMFFDGGTAGCCLTLRINHAQFDGISFPLLLEDLAALYSGTASDVSRWPGFSSFLCTAREMHDTGAADFYRGLLAGASMTEIASHKKPPYSSYPASQLLTRRVPRVELPERGITFAVVLKAAWAKVLAAVTGQVDVVFGYLVSGRSLPKAQIEDVVGPCINMTPVRVDTRRTSTVLELLDSVRDKNLQGMTYETYPFDKIVSHCTEWPPWTRFSTLLECQVAAIEPGTVPFGHGLKCSLSATTSPSDLADLVVDAMPSGSGDDGKMMRIQFLHSAERVPGGLVADMADLLCAYLDQIRHRDGLDSPWPSAAPAPKPIAMDPTRPTYDSTSQHVSKDATSDVADESKAAVIVSDVETVWRGIFGEVAMDPATPFYAIWSSPIAAAHLADLYNRLGYRMEMEDIIQHPTMKEQSVMLSRWEAPS
jgi:amino acid adenylation domain-containing protein